MANICNNMVYAHSEDQGSIKHIYDFIKHYFRYNIEDKEIVRDFDSKWVSLEDLMIEMYNTLPNKDGIYMRCLSYELGCLYHALWICDENGWHEE